MGCAAKLTEYNEAECKLSREFLENALESFTKQKVIRHANGVWLENPANKTTYNTCLIPPPHAQSGMIKFFLDKGGNPLYGLGGAVTWLLLHEAHANKVWFIHWPTLLTTIQGLVQNPQLCGGMMNVRWEGDLLAVAMHLDWAMGAKLIKHQGVLKEDFTAWREKKLVTKENFCHLHCHSEFSLLDGASNIENLALRAMLNGQPGIALTDHGNVFGAYKHWAACKELGVKSLIGVEAYLVDDVSSKYATVDGSARRFEYHQTIIAMNATGWTNLSKLLTAGARDHFHYVPRIDHNMLFKHNEGLIVLSGCFKGMAAHYLQTRPLKEGETELPPWYVRDPEKSRQYIRMYKKVFGDRYYGELQNIDYEPYRAIVPELKQILMEEGVPLVCTNDCHYEKEEDAIVQSVLSRISRQRVDGIGEGLKEKGVYFIRSRAEMEAGAPWSTPDMYDRSVEIMDRCSLTFEKDGYLFPHFDISTDPDWAAFEASRAGGTRGQV